MGGCNSSVGETLERRCAGQLRRRTKSISSSSSSSSSNSIPEQPKSISQESKQATERQNEAGSERAPISKDVLKTPEQDDRHEQNNNDDTHHRTKTPPDGQISTSSIAKDEEDERKKRLEKLKGKFLI